MATPKRLRPTRVGGPPPKQRRLMPVSVPSPVGLPSPMLQQCGHFRLKGSPKRKNFKPKECSQASVDKVYHFKSHDQQCSTVIAGRVRVYALALCGLVSVVNYCYLPQLRNYHLPHTRDTFHNMDATVQGLSLTHTTYNSIVVGRSFTALWAAHIMLLISL